MTEALGEASVPQSPGLAAGTRLGRAFELKFHLTVAEGQDIEAWARQHLSPDPHGAHGTYRITTVYCDTPLLDMFHRMPGYRRCKFRVRRYDAASFVYLERKTRRGDQVRKKRSEIPAEELARLTASMAAPDWQGHWFLERIRLAGLRPTCRVAYRRTAFFGRAGDAPIRLTLDRELMGMPASGWEPSSVDAGRPLLPGGVLVELKFHLHLPPLFHELLPRLPAQPARVSKYRRCVELHGLDKPEHVPMPLIPVSLFPDPSRLNGNIFPPLPQEDA
jgi:hypothetical protein